MNQKTADALAELWNKVWLDECSDSTIMMFMNPLRIQQPMYTYIFEYSTKRTRRKRIEKVMADNGFELVWEEEC